MRLGVDFTVSDLNKCLLGLILFEVVLVGVYCADVWLGGPSFSIHQLFDVNGEGTLPAWFSSIQLFLIGLLFTVRSRQSGPRAVPSRLSLLTVGLGFVFLSVDEVAEVHEKLSRVLRDVEFIPHFKGGNGFWIPIYLAIGLTLFLANARALVALLKRHRYPTLVMAVGVGMVALGGVGLEVLSYQFLLGGTRPVLHTVEVVLEEFLEMAGASVTLYGVALLNLPQGIPAPIEP